jgi:hypothetical protein
MEFKKFSDFNKTSKTRKIYEQELTLEKPEEKPEVTKPESGEVTKSEPSKFFSKIFEARQMAHIYHLQVKGDMGSHAAHIALNEYYDGLLDLLDSLIEAYQGQYEVVENYELIDTKDTNSKDKIEYFTELTTFIKDTRKMAFLEEDTHLQNTIDEIVALTYRLLYKLKYNK